MPDSWHSKPWRGNSELWT